MMPATPNVLVSFYLSLKIRIMSKRESILRYIHIINRLRKGQASFEQIDSYLEQQSELQGYRFSVSKRQFQRDVRDIESIFEFEINYDFRRKVYMFEESEQSEVSKRRMEALDTFSALKFAEATSEMIHFEKRKSQGTEHLYGLLHAIKNRLEIAFTYQKYWEGIASQRSAEPYALKEFRSRWYVLAKDMKDQQVKSFALDRLTELEITRKTFPANPPFDVNDHYKFCFGIMSPAGHELHEVILRFEPVQGRYIKSLPLHETQEILVDNDQELRVKLKIYLTHDFMMEILSFGENLQVIQPESLINQIRTIYRNALDQY